MVVIGNEGTEMTYTIKMKGQKKTIIATSLEDARKVFMVAQDGVMARGGVIRSAEVIKDGSPFARISQNGNVWPMEEWTPGQKPLVGRIYVNADLTEEYHSNL